MYRLYVRQPNGVLQVPWNAYELPLKHVRIEDHSRWTPYRHTVQLRCTEGALDAMLIVRNRPSRTAAYQDTDYLEHLVLPQATAALDTAIASVLDRAPAIGEWSVTGRAIRGPPKVIAHRTISDVPAQTSLSDVVDAVLARRCLPYDSIAVMPFGFS